MTSFQGDHQLTDYSYMYDFIDDSPSAKYTSNSSVCQAQFTCNQTVPNTLQGWLATDPRGKRFYQLVKIAGMEGMFADCEANFTLFVPNTFTDRVEIQQPCPGISKLYGSALTDPGTARQIVTYSSLNRKVRGETLRSEQFMYLYPRDFTGSKIIVVNSTDDKNCQTVLNTYSTVQEWDICLSNGMIHVVSDMLVPWSEA